MKTFFSLKNISDNWQTLCEYVDCRINPICVLGLRTTLRTDRFFWVFSVCLLLMAVILMFSFAILAEEYRGNFSNMGRSLFFALYIIQLIFIALLFPAFTCTAIVSEKEKKSYELLITSNLSPGQVILGKFLSAFVYMFLFTVATAPLVSVFFLYGGVSVFMIELGYLVIFLFGALMIIFPLWASSFYKTTIKAIIFGYTTAWVLAAFLLPFCIGCMAEILFDDEIITFFSTWGKEQILTVVTIFFAYAFIFTYPYIAAINQICSPIEHSKSRNIRTYIFWLFTISASIAYMWYLFTECTVSNGKMNDMIYVFYVFMIVIFGSLLTCSAIGLPLQSKLPHIEILKDTKFKIGYIFYPGAHASIHFNLLISSIIFTSCFFLFYCISSSFRLLPHVYELQYHNLFYTLPITIVVYIFFIASLGSWLYLRLGKKHLSAVTSIGYTLFVLLLALQVMFSLALYGRYYATFYNLSFLSPILACLSSVANLDKWASDHYDPVNLYILDIPIYIWFILFHVILGVRFYFASYELHKKLIREALEKDTKLIELLSPKKS